MQIHQGFSTLPQLTRPVVAIGTFDGVHRGHLAIIERVKERAAETGGQSVILTFYPHPRMVLHPGDHGLKLLNTRQEKAELLATAGIEHLVEYPFSAEFSRLTAEEYVRELLVNGIGASIVVAGFDHRFGRNREGDFDLLTQLADVYGFSVEEIPAQLLNEVKVSSTKIRESLSRGEVEVARQLLGYSYRLAGIVVHGEGRGRSTGYPTANLKPVDADKLMPARGVYAVLATDGRNQWHGAMNIGLRPTVSHTMQPTAEVHLLDFEGDLYGNSMTVHFESRIRDEQKFGSVDDLVKQIEKDIAWTRHYFATRPRP